MRWPWTSRVEAAERSATLSEHRSQIAEAAELRASERLDSFMADANQRVADAQAERDAARAEVKLLLDRIVQMSGQPPIFHPAPIPAAPTAPSPEQLSSIPAPETRVSFDDIHRRTRAAIADGSLNILNQPRTN